MLSRVTCRDDGILPQRTTTTMTTTAAATAPVPSSSGNNSISSSTSQKQQSRGDDNASSTASSWAAGNNNNNNQSREEGDEYLIPITKDHNNPEQDALRRQQRRAKKRQQQLLQQLQQQQDAAPPSPPPSFSDRLTSSAVSGTLGLLRLASDVTLSTTGKLVAPPLQATQHLLLPTLFAAVRDYVSSITSQRVKDWFRIVQSSLHHLVSVLLSTPVGQEFRQDVVNVGADVMDCLSSDSARQVITDAMACVVKFSEAIHTPQVKAWLDQCGILSCRCMDAASSGRVKQLWLDVLETVWSGTAVLADPATTMALAEVTAHLCHALEMEDAVHRHVLLQQRHVYQEQEQQQDQQQQEKKNKSNPSSTSASLSSSAAQRRYRRNQYQASAYVHADLTVDPDASVEDVIVSSLGDLLPAASTNNSKVATATITHTIPQQVTLTTTGIAQQQQEKDDEDDQVVVVDDPSVSKSSTQQSAPPLLYNHIPGKAREETVHVEYLRDCIQQRYHHGNSCDDALVADADRRTPTIRNGPEGFTAPNEDDRHNDDDNQEESLEDLEELITEREVLPKAAGAIPSSAPSSSSQRQRKPVVVVQDVNEDDDDDNDDEDDYENDQEPSAKNVPTKTAGTTEAPVAQFYRILDEILTEKRQEAIQAMLAQADDDDDDDHTKDPVDAKTRRKKQGRVWYPQAAAAAGAGNERGQATIRSRLSQLYHGSGSNVGLGYGHNRHHRRHRARTIPRQYQNLARCVMATIAVVATTWFGLGCYGIYKLLYVPPHNLGASRTLLSSMITPSSSSPQEIVIRVIREVVHINAADGSILHQEDTVTTLPPHLATTPMELNSHTVDQIAECVAAASASSSL